jgi:hypothetical protein
MSAASTTTSMTDVIAHAGIMLRNSILGDFINLEKERSVALARAVVDSARPAKSIALTSFAAILDALFILDDPNFNRLAIELIFVTQASTLPMLVAILMLRQRELAVVHRVRRREPVPERLHPLLPVGNHSEAPWRACSMSIARHRGSAVIERTYP